MILHITVLVDLICNSLAVCLQYMDEKITVAQHISYKSLTNSMQKTMFYVRHASISILGPDNVGLLHSYLVLVTSQRRTAQCKLTEIIFTGSCTRLNAFVR